MRRLLLFPFAFFSNKMVLAHVLKLMDQDLCLTPVAGERPFSSTTSAATPTKSSDDRQRDESSTTVPPSSPGRETSAEKAANVDGGQHKKDSIGSVVPVTTTGEGRGPLALVRRRLHGALVCTLRYFSLPWRAFHGAWKRTEGRLMQLKQRRAQEEACACFSD